MFRPLSSGPAFPSTTEGRVKLFRFLRCATLPEYGLVPLFYVLGWYQYFLTASVLQAAFAIGSVTFQIWVFLDGLHEWDSRIGFGANYKASFKPLETLFGISISRVQRMSESVFGRPLPKWLYDCVLQVPNYVHVQQTAVVAASSWATWSPALAAEFARRWQDVPLFGWLGLPGLLTLTVALSCTVHMCVAICSDDEDEVADAANLLFLGKMLPHNGAGRGEGRESGVGFSRLVATFLVKTPMLWLKVSLLTLTWQCMDGQQRAAMLVAVALAWYAVIPAVQRTVAAMKAAFKNEYAGDLFATPGRPNRNMYRDMDRILAVIGTGLLVVLLVIFLHMLGLPLCESNDLSVLHGCTPPSHVQLCANSTQ